MPYDLAAYLDTLAARFEQPAFIKDDPIAIPHGFSDPRDQEIAGLFAAILAWGRRSVILDKLHELCERMRFAPHAFVTGFDAGRDAERLAGFKHRTFKPEDAIWLIRNLQGALREHGTVEALFTRHLSEDADHVGPAIQGFSDLIATWHPDTPSRLRKHLARPERGSAAKRLSMYLRWMVRPGPVDFGLWSGIRTDQLVLPLDVHSGRQARKLGLLTRKQNDWKAVLELTAACRRLDPDDPCRYDFAFFGAGAYNVPLDPRFTSEDATG